jgi:hypothetical protein
MQNEEVRMQKPLNYDLPHLFPLPKERTYQSMISGGRKIIRPIPSHNISNTRRTFLPLLEERAGVGTVVKNILVFVTPTALVFTRSSRRC